MQRHEAAAAAPRPADRSPAKSGRVGILLMNLGTPDATDYWSMRRYLKEFLSDPRVIETPRWLWWPLLNLIILTTRPGRKGRDYETIWNRQRNESPLKTITRSQAEKLAAALDDGRIVVDWAMRYGNPSVASRLEVLQRQGCDRILVAPLYPQYAAATTATACDKAFEALMKMRWQPTIRVLPPYHDDPVYIDAVAASLRTGLGKLPFEPEVILASFHGVPRDYVLKGDPYERQCIETVALLRAALGLPEDRLMLTFQSRFGRAEWLQPYTDMTVKGLAEKGVRRLAVVMPGFSADCLETLEEIAGENAEIFRHHGGDQFAAIPCLNDSPEGMAVIEHLVRRELQGWL
ncbi:ferrochelatase [Chelatococcus sp. SYSU_G07232]|uniref:Ferrochelatase n=1 Tax=Chelatococcus albus TaxID=3047466 RepID=A0ABT7AG38_9HYPH|nr:ferrochelatase [Chelatococcus sp. SYSU_G07232]MDJ1158322.1 ferrochelatase [Chelatococcus sp. SYSU_G07232]